ncbi:hypothetical protein CSUI_000289 [Cystoisospora suis]|uniref:Uncharacterized protein n=1 Tax=Cystoisospora suis TaxID=483139 RepID=A0A2C6LHD8_9APIC|nr:hypothetical protein CSUI_000289 [Cystoisospora suis]
MEREREEENKGKIPGNSTSLYKRVSELHANYPTKEETSCCCRGREDSACSSDATRSSDSLLSSSSSSKCMTSFMTYEADGEKMSLAGQTSLQKRRSRHRETDNGKVNSEEEEVDLVSRMKRLLNEVAHRTATFEETISRSCHPDIPMVGSKCLPVETPPCGMESLKTGEKSKRERGERRTISSEEVSVSRLTVPAGNSKQDAGVPPSPVFSASSSRQQMEGQRLREAKTKKKDENAFFSCLSSTPPFPSSIGGNETVSTPAFSRKTDTHPRPGTDDFFPLDNPRASSVHKDSQQFYGRQDGEISPHTRQRSPPPSPFPSPPHGDSISFQKTSTSPLPWTSSKSRPVSIDDNRSMRETSMQTKRKDKELFLLPSHHASPTNGSCCNRRIEGKVEEDRGVLSRRVSSCKEASRCRERSQRARKDEMGYVSHNKDGGAEEERRRSSGRHGQSDVWNEEMKLLTQNAKVLSDVHHSFPIRNSEGCEEREEREKEDKEIPPWKLVPGGVLPPNGRLEDFVLLENSFRRSLNPMVCMHREEKEKGVHRNSLPPCEKKTLISTQERISHNDDHPKSEESSSSSSSLHQHRSSKGGRRRRARSRTLKYCTSTTLERTSSAMTDMSSLSFLKDIPNPPINYTGGTRPSEQDQSAVTSMERPSSSFIERERKDDTGRRRKTSSSGEDSSLPMCLPSNQVVESRTQKMAFSGVSPSDFPRSRTSRTDIRPNCLSSGPFSLSPEQDLSECMTEQQETRSGVCTPNSSHTSRRMACKESSTSSSLQHHYKDYKKRQHTPSCEDFISQRLHAHHDRGECHPRGVLDVCNISEDTSSKASKNYRETPYGRLPLLHEETVCFPSSFPASSEASSPMSQQDSDKPASPPRPATCPLLTLANSLQLEHGDISPQGHSVVIQTPTPACTFFPPSSSTTASVSSFSCISASHGSLRRRRSGVTSTFLPGPVNGGDSHAIHLTTRDRVFSTCHSLSSFSLSSTCQAKETLKQSSTSLSQELPSGSHRQKESSPPPLVNGLAYKERKPTSSQGRLEPSPQLNCSASSPSLEIPALRLQDVSSRLKGVSRSPKTAQDLSSRKGYSSRSSPSDYDRPGGMKKESEGGREISRPTLTPSCRVKGEGTLSSQREKIKELTVCDFDTQEPIIPDAWRDTTASSAAASQRSMEFSGRDSMTDVDHCRKSILNRETGKGGIISSASRNGISEHARGGPIRFSHHSELASTAVYRDDRRTRQESDTVDARVNASITLERRRLSLSKPMEEFTAAPADDSLKTRENPRRREKSVGRDDLQGHRDDDVRSAAGNDGESNSSGRENEREKEPLSYQDSHTDDNDVRAAYTSLRDSQRNHHRHERPHSEARAGTRIRAEPGTRTADFKENLRCQRPTADPFRTSLIHHSTVSNKAERHFFSEKEAPNKLGSFAESARTSPALAQASCVKSKDKSHVRNEEQGGVCGGMPTSNEVNGDAIKSPGSRGRESVKSEGVVHSVDAGEQRPEVRRVVDQVEQSAVKPYPSTASPVECGLPHSPSQVQIAHLERALPSHLRHSSESTQSQRLSSSQTASQSLFSPRCSSPTPSLKRQQPSMAPLVDVVESCKLTGCPPSFDISSRGAEEETRSPEMISSGNEKPGCLPLGSPQTSVRLSPSRAWSSTLQSPGNMNLRLAPLTAKKETSSSMEFAGVSKTRLRRRAAALFRELVRAEALQPDTAEALRVAVQKQLYGAKSNSSSGKFTLTSEEEELLQCTFRPQINRYKRVGGRDADRPRQPWWQRLYNGHRTSELKRELQEIQTRVRLMTEMEEEEEEQGVEQNKTGRIMRLSEEIRAPRGASLITDSPSQDGATRKNMRKPTSGGRDVQGDFCNSSFSVYSPEKFQSSSEECSPSRLHLRNERGRRRAVSQTGVTPKKSVRFETPDVEVSRDREKCFRHSPTTPRAQRGVTIRHSSVDTSGPSRTRDLCGTSKRIEKEYSRQQTKASQGVTTPGRSIDVLGARKVPVTGSRRLELQQQYDDEEEQEENCGFFTPYITSVSHPEKSTRGLTHRLSEEPDTPKTRVRAPSKWRNDQSKSVTSTPINGTRNARIQRVGAEKAEDNETDDSCVSRQLLKTYLGGRQFVPGWLDVW